MFPKPEIYEYGAWEAPQKLSKLLIIIACDEFKRITGVEHQFAVVALNAEGPGAKGEELFVEAGDRVSAHGAGDVEAAEVCAALEHVAFGNLTGSSITLSLSTRMASAKAVYSRASPSFAVTRNVCAPTL